MIRILRNTAAANLVISAVAACSYVVYAIGNHLPVDQSVLGVGPGKLGRGASGQIHPWVFVVATECGIISFFVLGKLMQWGMNTHKKAAGIVGLIGLYMTFVSVVSGVASPRLDTPLAFYVWCSHIVYAAIGPAD